MACYNSASNDNSDVQKVNIRDTVAASCCSSIHPVRSPRACGVTDTAASSGYPTLYRVRTHRSGVGNHCCSTDNVSGYCQNNAKHLPRPKAQRDTGYCRHLRTNATSNLFRRAARCLWSSTRTWQYGNVGCGCRDVHLLLRQIAL